VTTKHVGRLAFTLALIGMLLFGWLATKDNPQFNLEYALYTIMFGFLAVITNPGSP
jgi:hypothetical protein